MIAISTGWYFKHIDSFTFFTEPSTQRAEMISAPVFFWKKLRSGCSYMFVCHSRGVSKSKRSPAPDKCSKYSSIVLQLRVASLKNELILNWGAIYSISNELRSSILSTHFRFLNIPAFTYSTSVEQICTIVEDFTITMPIGPSAWPNVRLAGRLAHWLFRCTWILIRQIFSTNITDHK